MTREMIRRTLKTIAAAFSMFSAIPMPAFSWDEDASRYLLCAFPLTGLAAGLLMLGWQSLCQGLGWPDLLRAWGLTLLPLLVSGGIHMDGACDTWDALASHGSREKLRGILKDPHIGSFAVIRLIAMIGTTFALWSVLPFFPALPVCLMFVLSRALSGWAVVSFPIADGSTMAAAFASGSALRTTKAVTLVTALLAGAGMTLFGGGPMAAGAAAALLSLRFYLVPRFGGLSGDLSGWFLQTAELWMLAVLCLWEYWIH